mgnify:FL=1
MAALETIRQKFGIGASIIIAIGLLLFLVNPSDIIQAVQSASSKYDVGKINGKSVSYTDFEQEVKKFSEISEMMTGTSSSSEQQQKQIREVAWQNLLEQNLFIPAARKAGINVGEDEIMDLTFGESISPVIASNRYFLDENGNFSIDRLRDFVQQVSDDESGRGQLLWNYLQNTISSTQYSSKYTSLFNASSFQNALQVEKNIAENNTTADVRFVLSPFSFATDSTVVVSDKEIKEFYKNHRDFFKQNASRDIEYAVYEVVPSKEDISAQNEEFVRLYDDFAGTDNVRAFLQRNSDRQYTDRWYKAGELNSVNRDVEAFVAANNAGTSPVIRSGNTFLAARIMDNAMLPDSVYVRHIMLQGADADHLADSLLTVLNNKGSFSNLVALYSVDKGSAADDELGNIGWLTQNVLQYLPAGFEGAFTAPVGKPYVLKTAIGTHVVEVTKATRPVAKKQVAIFEKEALASKETFNKFYNDANRLATLAAGKYSSYKAACDSIGIYSRALTINEGTDTYGAIDHAKEVTRWAFDNKPGKASNIITVNNNYFFVVAVKEAHKEGFADVNEVAQSIRNELYQEKYAAKREAEVAEQIAGLTDLDAIAEKLGTTVSTQSDVAFSSLASRSVDPKFLGAIASAKEGVISGPVAGYQGVYVFEVTGRNTGSFYTEDDARTAQQRLNTYAAQMLMPVMMEKDVKDNRSRFY